MLENIIIVSKKTFFHINWSNVIACQVFQIGGIMAGFVLWFCTQLVSCILVKLNLEVRTITDIPSPKLTFLYIAEINSKIMITVIAVNSLICLNVAFGAKTVQYICSGIFQISDKSYSIDPGFL